MFLLPKFLLLAKQDSPAFNPLTSSLSGLIESLTKMKADSFVQQELDKIAFSDAFRYSRAIQYLVDEKTALCYTHFDLTKFDAKLENSNQLDTSDTYLLRYTSKTFRIKASLYCIAPRTRSHHIGFIQHCIGKEDTAYFDDGSFNSRVPSVSFPIGDSAGAEHAPFYYRPTANNNAPAYGNKTVHPPHMNIAGKSGWQNLEMNDYFNRNSIPRHPKFKNGSTTASYRLTSHLINFERSQSFVCWLARIGPTNEEKLLHEVRYHLINEVSFNHATSTATLKSDSSSIEFSGTPVKTRPSVSASFMNGIESLMYHSHIGAAPVNVN